jgi:hypothetical protein
MVSTVRVSELDVRDIEEEAELEREIARQSRPWVPRYLFRVSQRNGRVLWPEGND